MKQNCYLHYATKGKLLLTLRCKDKTLTFGVTTYDLLFLLLMAYHSNISVATCYLCRRSNLKLLNVKIFTIICIRIAAKYDLFSSFHNHPYFCYIAQVFIVYKKVRVYATDSNPYPRPIPKQVPHKNGPTTGLVCLVSPFSVLWFSRVLKCHLANQNATTIISLQLSKVMATDYLFN